MYKAIITNVEKKEDAIHYTVEYTNGEESYERNYTFSLAQDITNVFKATMAYELKRLEELDTIYQTEKERIGEELTREGESLKISEIANNGDKVL